MRADCENRRMPSRLRGVALWCCVSGLLCIMGCEGSTGNPGDPSPLPTPRVVQQGSFPLAAPEGDTVYFAIVPIPESSGALWEATADWTSGTNTLWMWVANGVCTVEQFEKPECPFEASCPCQFAIRSEVATPKPRVLSISNATAATRTLIVANIGPGAETVNYRVMVTSANLRGNALSPAGAGDGAHSSVVAVKKVSGW